MSARRLNILCLCHEFPPVGGGGAIVCAALGRHYSSAGHRVTVATMGFGRLAEREELHGMRIHRIPCGRRRKEMSSAGEGLRWAYHAWKLVDRLHARQPFDATHAHFIMPAGIVADWLQRSRGVPFMITPHGSDVPGHNRRRMMLEHALARPWWKRICRRADRIVAPATHLLELIDAVVQDYCGTVIPNGTESARFQPLQKRNRILLCGRLIETKGFQHFLKGITALELPGWHVDTVGEGPLFRRLKELADRCQVPVTFHGHLAHADPRLARLYGEAMIFVFPSQKENFSVALLEAMSAGCTVIATNIPGNVDAVGDCGYLVPSRDPKALQVAVSALVADPDRCRDLGQRAARRVRNKFDWGTIACRYVDLLHSLAANRTQTTSAAA